MLLFMLAVQQQVLFICQSRNKAEAATFFGRWESVENAFLAWRLIYIDYI
jgi:hypothetical protein